MVSKYSLKVGYQLFSRLTARSFKTAGASTSVGNGCFKGALTAVAIGLVQDGDSASSHVLIAVLGSDGVRLGCPYVKRAEIALGARL